MYGLLAADRMLWGYLGSGGAFACILLIMAVQGCCQRRHNRGQPFVFNDKA
ncbi:MAG: hypothetical protein HDT19_02325 [Oscillibacter sp.]|nr:hypothetical protein [Oscillibacter sp.]